MEVFADKNIPPWLRSFSEEERAFLQRANEVNNRLFEGHIDHSNFIEIYQTYKIWTEEFEKQKKGSSSNIGADSLNKNLFATDDFRGLDLRWANLLGHEMEHADLRGNKTTANPRTHAFEIDFTHANLIGVDASRARGNGTLLRFALLIASDLSEADLSDSVLWFTDLRWSVLKDTNLRNAELWGAKLDGAIYEPLPKSLPDVEEMAYAQGLDKLVYERTPRALVELRTAFYTAGFGSQAREITHSIWKTKRVRLSQGSVWNRIESWVYYILFELTSKYGMTPYRPLAILVFLIPIFAIPYALVIARVQRAGIWANRFDTAVNKKVLREWIRIKYRVSSSKPVGVIRVARIALYFSLISAFRIGFNQFDIGNWLTRLQSSAYELRATGWVRSLAGWQALVSVYLLALSVFCFIGRPFG